MRETRLSGSVEGVMGNHDSYSDYQARIRHCAWPIHQFSGQRNDRRRGLSRSTEATRYSIEENQRVCADLQSAFDITKNNSKYLDTDVVRDVVRPRGLLRENLIHLLSHLLAPGRLQIAHRALHVRMAKPLLNGA